MGAFAGSAERSRLGRWFQALQADAGGQSQALTCLPGWHLQPVAQAHFGAQVQGLQPQAGFLVWVVMETSLVPVVDDPVLGGGGRQRLNGGARRRASRLALRRTCGGTCG